MIVIDRKGLQLEEVFNATGQWLYRSEWDGRELFARKLDSPESIREERRSIEAEIAKSDQPDALIEELRGIAVLTDRYEADYGRYERRQYAEKVVIDALASGELLGICLGGTIVPKECWASEEDDFRYCLELGIVELPENISSQRRHSLRIPETAFFDWIEGVPPVRDEPEAPLSPKVRAIIRLREAARNPVQPKSKFQFEEELRAEIPGLSERAFNEAWAQTVPPHWRKPGRRSWNN